MKFSLSCNVLFVLLTVYQLILCEDWTHSGEDNDEEEEKSRERQEAKSFQIPGILLPWVKTSRQHLFSIPKSLLVQINKNLHTDHLFEAPFFCRVEVVKGMKIIGKLNYDKQQCIIPGKFPLSLNEQMQTIKDEYKLMAIATSGEWPIFEVLINPRRLNLKVNEVYLLQKKGFLNTTGLIPARPVRAQSAPPSSSAHRKRHPPPSYLALIQYYDWPTRYYYYYPGIVVEEEVSQNGTLAFYYGLYNVYGCFDCTMYVVAVLNTRLPPPPIDYFRRFNKL